MSVYMTEEEQLKAIANWWNKYKTPITVIFSCVLLVVSGYKYWNWHQARVQALASNAYERMMMSYANQDKKATRSYANEITSQYPKSVYADVAHLVLAKMAVSHAKYDKAQNELLQVIDHTHVSALKQIAEMRLARIYALNKNYDAALDTLKTVSDAAYMPIVNELKGDIYASLGRYKEAVDAYQTAMKEVKDQGIGHPFLEMKSNELASLTEAMANKTDTIAQG